MLNFYFLATMAWIVNMATGEGKDTNDDSQNSNRNSEASTSIDGFSFTSMIALF